jgi:hypothetical protein
MKEVVFYHFHAKWITIDDGLIEGAKDSREKGNYTEECTSPCENLGEVDYGVATRDLSFKVQ